MFYRDKHRLASLNSRKWQRSTVRARAPHLYCISGTGTHIGLYVSLLYSQFSLKYYRRRCVVDPVCEVVQPATKGRTATLMCRMTYDWQAPAKQFNYPPGLNVSLSWTGVAGTTVKTTADPSTFRGTLETNMTIENVMYRTIQSRSCEIEFNFSPIYTPPGGFSTLTYAVNTVSSTCVTKEATVWCKY